jgi:mercuric ion transport protein
MNNSISEIKSCCCNAEKQNLTTEKSISKTRKTLKAIPSMLLSVLIAFFPKCPVCWAVYMSMFGSLGLAQLPYMGWLLPVLMVFLGIHLFMIYKKSAPNNYLPFLLSLTGAIIILVGRFSLTNEKWLPILGMLLIISGSLFIRFPVIRVPFFAPKHNSI